MKRGLLGLLRHAALAALVAVVASPARAEQEVKVGIGFGIGFLPAFICNELGLVEKHAKAAGLDLKMTYIRFSGSAAMQEAVLSGSADIGVYGMQAILIEREKASNTPQQQILGIAGVTTLPLVLLTNKSGVKSIKEFTAGDRIAMPSLVSPQMYALQIASEKAFGAGQYNRLRPLVVSLPHPEALAQLLGGSEITGYFSAAPFTQIALKNAKISTVMSSTDAFGGKASFLVAGATRRYLNANPKVAGALAKALDEAARIIRDDPKKAAEIYLKAEPSKRLDAAGIEAILKELRDDFGIDVHGVKTSADFMARIGQLKRPPSSWKEVFLPIIHDTNSD